MSRYTSLAVILLGAVALVLPYGYVIAPTLLALGSVVLLLRCPRLEFGYREWTIVGVLLLYGLVRLSEIWRSGSSLTEMTGTIYVFLAVPGLLLLLAFPPKAASIWVGAAVGSILTASWASWQTLVAGRSRADGFGTVDAIQFGNLSLLLGFFCLAGLGWVLGNHWRSGKKAGCALLLLGALCGVLGSFLSGSRGGWLSFPLMLGVLYLGYGRHLSRRWLIGFAAFFLIAPMVVYATPQLGVQERVQRIFSSYQEFAEEGDPTNSVGARLEMWRGASILIPERPLVGWGKTGYMQARDILIEEGTIHPYLENFDHVHNDVLDAWLKRGLLGLITLLALYLVPLCLFARHLRSQDIQLRALAIAGTALPIAYIGFGLTQTFLVFDSGVIMYIFWWMVIWVALCQRKRLSIY